MEKRTIKLTVENEYVRGAGVPVGAAGSHDEVELVVTFVGDVWLGTNKYVTFRDALGQSPRLKMLLDSESVIELSEDGDGATIQTHKVTVPYAAKTHAGNMSVTFTGYTVAETTDENGSPVFAEDECINTTTAYFRVLPSDYVILEEGSYGNDLTLAQQVLDAANNIANKMAEIDTAIEAANEAAEKTSDLNEQAEAAVNDAVERLGKLEGGIAQTTGNSKTQAMSQKATTEAIDVAKDDITQKMAVCQSENLCNPAEVVADYYMNAAGVIHASASYSYTGLIPVTEGDVLRFPYNNDGTIKSGAAKYVCAFDGDGNVVESAGAESVYTYTVPATIEGVIVTFLTAYSDFMILKNHDSNPSEVIEYFPPYYVATEDFLNGITYTKEEVDAKIAENSSGTTNTTVDKITKRMTLKVSENLCNPDEEAVGVVDVTGVANTNSSYKHTGHIVVTEGDVLTFYRASTTGGAYETQVHRVCAYDSTGAAVSDAGAVKVMNYTVPAGITSVVISCYATYTGFMVLKNYEGRPSAAIPYESPAYVATEEFLEGAVTWDVLDEEIKNKIIDYNPIETDYINAEIERVKRETLRDDGVLNFIFSTDQHLKADLGEMHIMQEVARVADLGQFDFVCMGGDMIQAGDTSWYAEWEDGVVVEDNGFVDKKETVVSNLSDIAWELRDVRCPVFYCLGNHDVCFGAYNGARSRNNYYGYEEGDAEYNDPNAQSLLPREFFRIFNNRLGETVVWDDNNPQCGYFYKDFARSKIRVVVLNSQDVFNDDGTVVNTVEDTSLYPLIQQKQLTWICDKALNFMDKGEERSEWAVIFLSHANVILGAASGGSVGTEVCSLLRGVLNAFMTGGTYTGTTSADYQYDFSVNVDFTQQGAVDFICSINGHVHADTVMNIGEIVAGSNIDRPSIQVSSANGTLDAKDYSESAYVDYFILPERTEGTITTECFDIFSIDRNARKIKTIRFGAGEDREISY